MIKSGILVRVQMGAVEQSDLVLSRCFMLSYKPDQAVLGSNRVR